MCSLFGDALGLPQGAYLYFPRPREWRAAAGHYREIFAAYDIRPQDTVLRLPNRRIYILPHVQEFLAGLDSTWEDRLTRRTLGVRNALEEGEALSPFPTAAWTLGSQNVFEAGNELPPSPTAAAGPARESDPLAAGVTPPEGATLASEGDPGEREETEPGGAVSVATANFQTTENREVAAPGHSPAPPTQPRVTPATSRATVSMSTGAVEGGRSTRGRRGRPRGCGMGTRATKTWRGTTTNRGRIPRHGSGEVPPAPAEGRVGGREREGGDGERVGPAPGDVTQLRAFFADDYSGTSCEGCRTEISWRHRVVGLPCGRQHSMHARCVVNAVKRGGAQAPLL